MDYTKESIQYELLHCLQGTIGQGVVHMIPLYIYNVIEPT